MKYEFFINFLFFSLFAFGAILLMMDDIELWIKRYQLRHRLKAVRTKEKDLPKPLQYIYNLVDSSFEKQQTKIIFLLGDFALYIIAFFLGRKNLTPIEALLSASILMAIPFILLASKLESDRCKSSLEGISLISELHRQYLICSGNIYEALERTALTDGDYKISSKRITSLLVRMRDASGPVALREAIQRFTFSYGTHWAQNLGQCILIAAEEGRDVSLGLGDITKQLKKAYSLEERSRMMNSEASRMAIFLVPLMYFGCFAVSIKMLGMSLREYINNQFFNPLGYKLFLINLFLFILSGLLLYWMKNSKLDY